jgi:hypothetical protein
MHFGDGADLIPSGSGFQEPPPTTIEVCIEDDPKLDPKPALALTADGRPAVPGGSPRRAPAGAAQRGCMVSASVQTEVCSLSPRNGPSPFAGPAASVPFSPAGPRARAVGEEEDALEECLQDRLKDPTTIELTPRPALKPVRTSSPDPSVSNGARGGGLSAGVGPGCGTAGGEVLLAPRAITRRIERCSSLQELEDFVAAHGANFNQVCRACACLNCQASRLALNQGRLPAAWLDKIC